MRVKILAIAAVMLMTAALCCSGILVIQAGLTVRDIIIAWTGRENPEPDPAPVEPGIFVGQRLVIPMAGPAVPDISKPVSKGLVSAEGRQIALTFDAGWLYDQTSDLLDVLDQFQVKSTFFLRGYWVRDYPELAREILVRGHCLENHSLTHGHMTKMTDAEIAREITETTRMIQETTGYCPYLFRPPYGEYDSRILEILGENGYPFTVMWTVDSHDWAREINGAKVTKKYLVERVLGKACDNGIVLMHVGGYETVSALPEIIAGLRELGYTLVKVNEMLPHYPSQCVHIVAPGETLAGIAQIYEITMESIIEANNLD